MTGSLDLGGRSEAYLLPDEIVKIIRRTWEGGAIAPPPSNPWRRPESNRCPRTHPLDANYKLSPGFRFAPGPPPDDRDRSLAFNVELHPPRERQSRRSSLPLLRPSGSASGSSGLDDHLMRRRKRAEAQLFICFPPCFARLSGPRLAHPTSTPPSRPFRPH